MPTDKVIKYYDGEDAKKYKKQILNEDGQLTDKMVSMAKIKA